MMPKLDNCPAPIIPPKRDPTLSDTIDAGGVWVAHRDWSVWFTNAALTDFALEEAHVYTGYAADLDAAAAWLIRPIGEKR
jgi:hypothetical protein